VLNALVSSEQIRFKRTSETHLHWWSGPRWNQKESSRLWAGDWEGTAAVSVRR